MSDDTNRKSGGSAAIDLILAGLGLWFGVSSLMAIQGSAPRANVATLPVVLAMDWIGAWPTLLAGLGLAAVGTWSFLAGRPIPRGRHALGALGLALGLAITLGAMVAGFGGQIGAVLPSLLQGMLGAVAGAGVGAAVLLATVWLAWSPAPDAAFSPKPGAERSIAAVGTPESASGVSNAEAEALITSVAPLPPRPAQPGEDVRNRGGVPRGAQPLDGPHARTPQAPDPGRPRQGQAPESLDRGAERARAHLAPARSLPAPSVQPLERPAAARGPAPAESDLKSGVRPLAEPEVAIRPVWETDPAGTAEPIEEPATGAAWEDPAGDAKVDVEEPDERRDAISWAQGDTARAEPEEIHAAEDLDEPELVVEGDDALEVLVAEEADETDEAEAEIEVEEVEGEEVLAGELAEFDLEAEAEDLAEPEELPADLAAEEALTSDVESPAPRVVKPPRKKDTGPVQAQSGLFDDAAPSELAEVEIPAAPPARAAARESEPAATAALPQDLEDLVFEAGCLILEENRVAVSMLQRRFSLDFDQATLVLDALQDRGLIGPYLGGKTRAILLSREEWAAQAPGV